MQSGPGLPQRLAAWRAAKDLTQQQVGATVGLTRQSIQYVEAGTMDLSVGKLETICRKAFKIDLLTFFGPLPKRDAA